MSIELPLAQARRTLGLGATFSADELRRAYRAMVRTHPPDRDPEGFRKVRAAFEALQHPRRVWDDWLTVGAPHQRAVDPEAAGSGQPSLADGADLLRAALTELLLGESLEAWLPEAGLDELDRSPHAEPESRGTGAGARG